MSLPIFILEDHCKENITSVVTPRGTIGISSQPSFPLMRHQIHPCCMKFFTQAPFFWLLCNCSSRSARCHVPQRPLRNIDITQCLYNWDCCIREVCLWVWFVFSGYLYDSHHQGVTNRLISYKPDSSDPEFMIFEGLRGLLRFSLENNDLCSVVHEHNSELLSCFSCFPRCFREFA